MGVLSSGRIALAIAVCALIVTSSADAQAAAPPSGHHWVGMWSTAPQNSYPQGVPIDPNQATTGGTLSPLYAATLSGRTPSYPLEGVFQGNSARDQSMRQIVRATIGGNVLRVRLTNRFGTRPVTFHHARVGLRRSGPALVPATNRRLRFAGAHWVTIPAGGEAVSDPVQLVVEPRQELAISLHVPGASGPMTWHAAANKTSYATAPGAGDLVADESGTPYRNRMAQWLFIDGVDTLAPLGTGTIVAFGDSITDGAYATFDADAGWPDVLARRLEPLPRAPERSVVDEGIGGNRLTLSAQPEGGPAGIARLDADVLSQPGVSHVILALGINDVAAGASATQIVGAMEQVTRRARARGLKVLGTTLTPGFPRDPTREAVNRWVRTNRAFDGVIDFDAVVRDPRNPSRWAAAYNSGDNLHPNAAGQRAMADSIDLSLLATPGPQYRQQRPRALRLRVATHRRAKRRLAVSARGTLLLPRGTTPALGCSAGLVSVRVRSRRRTVTKRVATLRPDCSFRSSTTIARPRSRRRRRSLVVEASFAGNEHLSARRAAARRLR